MKIAHIAIGEGQNQYGKWGDRYYLQQQNNDKTLDKRGTGHRSLRAAVKWARYMEYTHYTYRGKTHKINLD